MKRRYQRDAIHLIFNFQLKYHICILIHSFILGLNCLLLFLTTFIIASDIMLSALFIMKSTIFRSMMKNIWIYPILIKVNFPQLRNHWISHFWKRWIIKDSHDNQREFVLLWFAYLDMFWYTSRFLKIFFTGLMSVLNFVHWNFTVVVNSRLFNPFFTKLIESLFADEEQELYKADEEAFGDWKGSELIWLFEGTLCWKSWNLSNRRWRIF
jgi:hypothetical protein